MKFQHLHIENFLTIGSANVKLQDKGLHLIQGENEDNTSAKSNGAGKSSIVDAISWALFGVTARGVKGDKVVHNTRKKGTVVILTVQHGENIYKIERYRKHATGKNALKVYHITDPTGPSTDLTKGTDAETQKVVEEILGCSYEVFKAAVYCGQEEMPDLPRKTDKELKMLVEEAAGMDRIERAYEVARQRMTDAKNAASMAQTRVDSTAATLARIESSLELQRAERDSWEVGRATRVAAATQRVTQLTEATRAAIAELSASKPTYTANKARVAAIDEELANHGKLNAAAVAAEQAFNRANLAIDRAGLQQATNAVSECENRIANVDTAMSIPCGECGKPHTPEEKTEYLAHQNTLLAQLKVKRAEKATAVTAQAQAATTAKAAAEAARAAVPDVTTISDERKTLLAAIDKWDKSMSAATMLNGDTKAAIEAKALREVEPNPKASAVEMLEKQLVEETSKQAAQIEALDAARAKLEIAEAVVKVFGPAGVRAQILDSVTPFLNAQTADYLSVLTDGHTQATWTTLTKSAAGDLKEKFSIEVEDDQGSDCFDGLSGGEKKKVRIATALALQDLVASRATHPIDLWCGDEIDEALDSAGLERLMTLLERKARERGTVLVISHNELRDWCDEVTVVRKKDRVSTVEGSLCA
jgi:DNA repair exonuclease SbcCD ATPase subunit